MMCRPRDSSVKTLAEKVLHASKDKRSVIYGIDLDSSQGHGILDKSDSAHNRDRVMAYHPCQALKPWLA